MLTSYGLIIASLIIFQYLVSVIASILNLKSLRGELPQEFAGVYNPDIYKKSQEYTRTKTRFGWVVSSIELLATLLFWYFGGFAALDVWVRGWNFPLVFSGTLYMGTLAFVQYLAFLPFIVYSTFVIEERFGFNKTTLQTFILDQMKAIFLGGAIGAVLLICVLALLEYLGSAAWIYAWIAVAVFMFFMQFISPKWILPLFNRFEPLPEGELHDAIFDYAKKVKYSLKEIFVVDGSRRSTKTNAYFTGFGKNKHIALYNTLIEKHTTEELVSVLAHEIGHYKKRHISIFMGLSVLHAGILFFLLSLFLKLPGVFEAFYIQEMSAYTGLAIFSLSFTPIHSLISIFLNWVSRIHEFEADAFSAKTANGADTMICALKKLSKDNLENLFPHPMLVWLEYSHPPMLERIEALRRI